jgi:hypothetical protein
MGYVRRDGMGDVRIDAMRDVKRDAIDVRGDGIRGAKWSSLVLSFIIVSFIFGAAEIAWSIVFSAYSPQLTILGVNAAFVVVVATSAFCCLLLICFYHGPKSDFGPLWAWIMLLISVPILAILSMLLGRANDALIKSATPSIALLLSFWTFVIVLAVFMDARDSAISMEAAKSKDY